MSNPFEIYSKKIAITVFSVFYLSISRFFLVFGKTERKQGYDNRDNFSVNLIRLNDVNIKLNLWKKVPRFTKNTMLKG